MSSLKPITVIPVPFDFGASRRGAAEGPSGMLRAGLERKLQQLGLTVEMRSSAYLTGSLVDTRTSPKLRNWGKVLAMSEAVMKETDAALSSGSFPLLIGGDHSLAIGSIAGLRKHYSKLGVLWIDAHSDLNTPDSTPSGNIHGMSLGASLGLGDTRFVSLGDIQPKLDPSRVVLIGARQLDPGERDIIRSLGIACYTMHDIDRRGMASVMEEAIAIVSDGTDGVHLSFDIDSLDPGEAPGTGTPVRGGISYREAHLALELLSLSGVLTSAELVEVNPQLDRGHATARLAVELIGSLLGERIL
ncbi:arginase [Paenibacillus sp. GCM10023252]|uniref:arginase n=1 Tax=Paenibacillus sp. GCM10023252 TaxID=3252649 RepID=UPI00360A300F